MPYQSGDKLGRIRDCQTMKWRTLLRLYTLPVTVVSLFQSAIITERGDILQPGLERT